MKKKQHLDPKAKRDFTVLDQFDRVGIKIWLTNSNKRSACPMNSCNRCRDLFPEIVGKRDKYGGQKHPCHILCMKDVIEVAKAAIAWKQTNGNT